MVNNFDLSVKLEKISIILNTNLKLKKDRLETSKEIKEHYKNGSDFAQGLCNGAVNAIEEEIKHDEMIYSSVYEEVKGILEMIKEEQVIC